MPADQLSTQKHPPTHYIRIPSNSPNSSNHPLVLSAPRKLSFISNDMHDANVEQRFLLLASLPTELVLKTFDKLSKLDIASLSASCRFLNRLIYHTEFYSNVTITTYEQLRMFRERCSGFENCVREVTFDIQPLQKGYQEKYRQFQDEVEFKNSNGRNGFESCADSGKLNHSVAATNRDQNNIRGSWHDDYDFYLGGQLSNLSISKSEPFSQKPNIHDGNVSHNTQSSKHQEIANGPKVRPAGVHALIAEILQACSQIEVLRFNNVTKTFKFDRATLLHNVTAAKNKPLKLKELHLSASKNEYPSLNFVNLVPNFLFSSVFSLYLHHFLIDLGTVSSAVTNTNALSQLSSTHSTIQTLTLSNVHSTYSCLAKLSSLFSNVDYLALRDIRSMCNFRIVENLPSLASLTIDFNSEVFYYFSQYCYGYDFYGSSQTGFSDYSLGEDCYYDEVKTSYFLVNFESVFSEYFEAVVSHPKIKNLRLENLKFLNLFIRPLSTNGSLRPRDEIFSFNRIPGLDASNKSIPSKRTSLLQGQNLFQFFKCLANLDNLEFSIDQSVTPNVPSNENDWLNTIYPLFLTSSISFPAVRIMNSVRNILFSK